MTGEHNIDYETLAQDALRGIVRTVLMRAARSGLPGQHHFYIAFNTTAPGVSLSPRLKERYPEEMTIVLQHRFWDLLVNEERFEVKLTFDGIPERLVVPFPAIKVFFDPSVPYGLQFEGSEPAGDAAQDLGGEGTDAFDMARLGAAGERKRDAQVQQPAAARSEKKPRAPRKPRVKGEAAGTGKAAKPKLVTGKAEQPEAPANDTKVVQLDKFRKK